MRRSHRSRPNPHPPAASPTPLLFCSQRTHPPTHQHRGGRPPADDHVDHPVRRLLVQPRRNHQADAESRHHQFDRLGKHLRRAVGCECWLVGCWASMLGRGAHTLHGCSSAEARVQSNPQPTQPPSPSFVGWLQVRCYYSHAAVCIRTTRWPRRAASQLQSRLVTDSAAHAVRASLNAMSCTATTSTAVAASQTYARSSDGFSRQYAAARCAQCGLRAGPGPSGAAADAAAAAVGVSGSSSLTVICLLLRWWLWWFRHCSA